jgi:hypothetical protein
VPRFSNCIIVNGSFLSITCLLFAIVTLSRRIFIFVHHHNMRSLNRMKHNFLSMWFWSQKNRFNYIYYYTYLQYIIFLVTNSCEPIKNLHFTDVLTLLRQYYLLVYYHTIREVVVTVIFFLSFSLTIFNYNGQ